MSKFMTLILSSFLFLTSLVTYAASTEEHLYQCLLNKSETLNIFLIKDSRNDTLLKMQIKHFLGETRDFTFKPSMITRYGNTFMVVADFGRSGYFLLRAQENYPSTSDNYGNVLMHLDNSLFNPNNQLLSTKGELQLIRDCSRVGNY